MVKLFITFAAVWVSSLKSPIKKVRLYFSINIRGDYTEKINAFPVSHLFLY